MNIFLWDMWLKYCWKGKKCPTVNISTVNGQLWNEYTICSPQQTPPLKKSQTQKWWKQVYFLLEILPKSSTKSSNATSFHFNRSIYRDFYWKHATYHILKSYCNLDIARYVHTTYKENKVSRSIIHSSLLHFIWNSALSWY